MLIRSMPAKPKKNLQKATARVEYKEGGCHDVLTITLTIANEKIEGISLTPSKTSCALVKQALPLLEQHAKGKHIGDAYKITTDIFEKENQPHHSIDLLIHALREAILVYESAKANTSLQEALNLLQGYEEGLPQRDAKHDYEY